MVVIKLIEMFNTSAFDELFNNTIYSSFEGID